MEISRVSTNDGVAVCGQAHLREQADAEQQRIVSPFLGSTRFHGGHRPPTIQHPLTHSHNFNPPIGGVLVKDARLRKRRGVRATVLGGDCTRIHERHQPFSRY